MARLASLLVLGMLLGLLTQVEAYVDFHGLSHPAQRTETEDHVHYTHEVHHAFPETNTFFKANIKAKHEKKWHFVELHNHADMTSDVNCNMRHVNKDGTITVRNPTPKLIAELNKQDLKHTVVTAHPKHHCHGHAIFRQLTGVQVAQDNSAVTLQLKPLNYNSVMSHMDLEIQTNHVHMKDPIRSVRSLGPVTQPAAAKKRSMATQWFWDDSSSSDGLSGSSSGTYWGDFKNACERGMEDTGDAISDAASGVASAGHDVADGARDAASDINDAVSGMSGEFGSTLAGWGHDLASDAKDVASDASDFAADANDASQIAAGDFSEDKVWNLPGVSWNKQAGNSFKEWNIATSTVSIAGALSFTPTVTLRMSITDWDLQNVETYMEGAFEAKLSANFQQTLEKTLSGSHLITTIPISPITFAVGPVPVVLTPSIPINAGYTLNIDGQVAIGAFVSATATAKYGFGFSPATGYRTIKSSNFQYEHDFTPKSYSVDVGLKVYVQPVLQTQIDFIGKVGVGAAIYADVEVQSNDHCTLDLTINAQPIISISVGLGISLDGHKIFGDSWGPYSLWSAKYPLYSYCNGDGASASSGTGASGSGGSWFGRGFKQQDAVATFYSGTRDYSLNIYQPVITRWQSLGQRNVGRVWFGQGPACNSIMTYSAQFGISAQPGSSVLMVTMSKSAVPTNRVQGHTGDSSAIAHLIYKASSLPAAGATITYTLVNNTQYNYVASTTSSLSIAPAPTLTFTVGSGNIRFVSMSSSMTCGGVTMEAPESDNDNSTFTAFAHGYGAPNEVQLQSEFNVFVPLAVVATIVAAIAIGLASYFAGIHSARKSRRQAIAAALGEDGKETNLMSIVTQDEEELAAQPAAEHNDEQE